MKNDDHINNDSFIGGKFEFSFMVKESVFPRVYE